MAAYKICRRDPTGDRVYIWCPRSQLQHAGRPTRGDANRIMTDSNQMKAELSALASYLAGRREQILHAWLRAVELDPHLTTPSSISRAQFNDHIPQVLDAFERRLQAQDPEDKAQAHSEQQQSAAEHGLHRWQQGYNQREAIREWGAPAATRC